MAAFEHFPLAAFRLVVMHYYDIAPFPVGISASDEGLGFFYGYGVWLAKCRAGFYELCSDEGAFKSNACFIPGVGILLS